MAERHIRGSVGPGGPRCRCCGGATNTRKVFRTARRVEDREAIEEAIAEMHEQEEEDRQLDEMYAEEMLCNPYLNGFLDDFPY